MSRLETIEWNKVQYRLINAIADCPPKTRMDLYKIYDNVCMLARDVSRLEVDERRTMGSPGRRADEKLQQLQEAVQHLEQMMLIAHLQCG